VFPGRADTDYAWSIQPAVNAGFIGAGFLAGTLATGLVLQRATRCEGLIGYATLAAWSVPLLALWLLHPDDVSRRPGWYAVMVMLLALALHGLKLGWPERQRL